jgi:hypothetical protein
VADAANSSVVRASHPNSAVVIPGASRPPFEPEPIIPISGSFCAYLGCSCRVGSRSFFGWRRGDAAVGHRRSLSAWTGGVISPHAEPRPSAYPGVRRAIGRVMDSPYWTPTANRQSPSSRNRVISRISRPPFPIGIEHLAVSPSWYSRVDGQRIWLGSASLPAAEVRLARSIYTISVPEIVVLGCACATVGDKTEATTYVAAIPPMRIQSLTRPAPTKACIPMSFNCR